MTIPNELRRSTPRTVSLTRAGWKAILWPSLVAVCIVIVMQAQYTKHVTGVVSVLGWWYRDPLFDLGMILIGAGIGWMRYRRQANLMMYGRAATASVTDVEKRRNRVQREFRLLNGSLFTTTLGVPSRGKIPGIGAELVILYDRDEPKKAMLYPTRMLRVDNK